MHNRACKGITLLEMIIVCAVASVIVAISGIAWQTASANRKMDAAIAELEAGLALARQTAQNHDGAYIVFNVSSHGSDSIWELYPGSANATGHEPKVLSHTIPRVLNVSFSPATTQTIQFNSAGSLNEEISPFNSNGNCEITISIGGSSRQTTLTIVGMTGAVVKNVVN